MVNKGIVKEINGDFITVLLYKDSSCAHCSGCGQESKTGSSFVFHCSKELSVGDIVTLEMEDASILNIAALVYLLPVLFMLIGYFIGQGLGLDELKSAFLSFAGVIVSFGIIYTVDKKKGAKMIEQNIKIIDIEKHDPDSQVESCSQ